MSYPKILTVQDISCFGQCSLTVALPIISACGIETCVLPSAVLSTHTAGFKNFTFRDLTDDMPDITKHWQSENIEFDAVYTGYLGSTKQIEYVKNIIDTVLKKDGKVFVDPAMADNGLLYSGFDMAFVEEMKKLCSRAVYVIPNITEAALLTGIEYRTAYDEGYINSLVDGLLKLGAENVVLTGVSYHSGKTGVLTVVGNEKKYYEHEKCGNGCHGTGDIYSSAFVGAVLRGQSAEKAAKTAADYTVLCIKNTLCEPNHWYGAKFEPALPELIKMLEK